MQGIKYGIVTREKTTLDLDEVVGYILEGKTLKNISNLVGTNEITLAKILKDFSPDMLVQVKKNGQEVFRSSRRNFNRAPRSLL